jgi:Family of unknown function (DUF5995)
MKTIDDVIKRLDEIIAWAEKNQSTIGYFAVLYRRMTIAVKVGIEKNQFEDGARMEKLDVVFANRYFEAFDLVQKKTATTKAWHSAFEATKSNEITVIQHLLLGINAHINLDLGIAASNISKKEDILKLEKDFKQINTIISALIDDTRLKLSKIWLPFRIFTVLLKTESDGIINFSIKVARTFSWENAKILTNLEDKNKPNHIQEMDKNVAFLAEKIVNPKWFMKTVIWIMRKGESGTVNEKIQMLK